MSHRYASAGTGIYSGNFMTFRNYSIRHLLIIELKILIYCSVSDEKNLHFILSLLLTFRLR